METPKRPSQANCNNNDNDGAENPSSPKTPSPKTPPPKEMNSPRTPIQRFNDSLDDEDTDEMDSPQFRNLLLPMHRRIDDDDMDDDVRIGWDDGYSVFYRDDDCRPRNNWSQRRRNGRRSGRQHRSLFNPFSYDAEFTTPSPKQCPTVDQALINKELNDYLSQILKCLSAQKRNRQLMKLKNETSSTNTDSVESNIENSLFNDSADDEMMLLCSQAVEKSIAADTICNNMNATSSAKRNSLSIVGISPLKDTNNAMNNNVYHHVTKKFKPVHLNFTDEKKNENVRFPCHTITSNTEKKSLNYTTSSSTSASSTFTYSTSSSTSASSTFTNSIKDDCLSAFNDSAASDDDLFSAIDLSAIEQQIPTGVKETTSLTTAQKDKKVCNKQQKDTNMCDRLENNLTCSTSTTNSPNSLLWRRSSSSSAIVNKQLQSQGYIYGQVNSKPSHSGTTTKRYCTPAEIEAKRERARRTLMLKFKSKNKSAA